MKYFDRPTDDRTSAALARGATVLPDLGGGLPPIDIDWEIYNNCLTRVLKNLRDNRVEKVLEAPNEPRIARIPSNIILGEN